MKGWHSAEELETMYGEMWGQGLFGSRTGTPVGVHTLRAVM